MQRCRPRRILKLSPASLELLDRQHTRQSTGVPGHHRTTPEARRPFSEEICIIFVKYDDIIFLNNNSTKSCSIGGTVKTSRKRERFVLLAERRVNRAIDSLRLVGNLSNRSNYEYTDSDVKQIVAALESSLTELRQRFRSPSSQRESLFKLTKS